MQRVHERGGIAPPTNTMHIHIGDQTEAAVKVQATAQSSGVFAAVDGTPSQTPPSYRTELKECSRQKPQKKSKGKNRRLTQSSRVYTNRLQKRCEKTQKHRTIFPVICNPHDYTTSHQNAVTRHQGHNVAERCRHLKGPSEVAELQGMTQGKTITLQNVVG